MQTMVNQKADGLSQDVNERFKKLEVCELIPMMELPHPTKKCILIIFDSQIQTHVASLHHLGDAILAKTFCFCKFLFNICLSTSQFPSRLVFFLNWAVVKQVKGRLGVGMWGWTLPR